MNDTLQIPPIVDACWRRIGVWGTETPRCPKLDTHIHCRNCETYRSAAQQLRNRALSDDYRNEWTAAYAAPAKTRKTANQTRGLMFQLGNEYYSIPAIAVAAVADQVSTHRIPHHPRSGFLGVVNIQGHLELCMDLKDILGVSDKAAPTGPASSQKAAYPRTLLLAHEQRTFAVHVDAVTGTHLFSQDQIAPAPNTLANGQHRFLRGMLADDGREIGCLDDALLFLAMEKSLS